MTRRLRYVVLDVFADAPFAGNPLAVFPDGRGLTDALMQSIAKELNLSETTFVLPPTDPAKAAARVRIFTPHEELPYAGHPSVGTHWVLAEEGGHPGAADGRTRIVQEVGAGLLAIDIDREGGRVVRVLSTQAKPVFSAPIDAAMMAPLLGLDARDVGLPGLPVQTVNTGVAWLIVPVRDHEALRRVALAPDAKEKLTRLGGRHMVYPFTMPGFEPGTMSAARGLVAGEFEDPVTGSASGCLGAYLAKHGAVKPDADGVARFTHTQGHGMGRPGRVTLEVTMRAADPVSVRIGGRCVRVAEGEFLIDANRL
jgi:trans-2,3-dihydro-3-hydroxyanthranilate isomerase